MSNPTKDTPRVYENAVVVFDDRPVAAAVTLYEGMAVLTGGTSGASVVSGSSGAFAGFVEGKADNNITGAVGAAKAINVRLRAKGIVKLPVTGVAAESDVGSTVYATDSNTFTLTSTGAIAIGKVHRWVTSTTCMVAFEAESLRSL